jgi:hypothetical protein
VALGNGASCNNQLQAPCSLNINGPSPGCNIPCGSTQIYDGKTASYLLKNPNIVWQLTDAANMWNIINPIKIPGSYNFLFGRIQVNGNYILGKVQAGNGFYGFQALTSNGPIQNATGFEILTCKNPSCCEFFYLLHLFFQKKELNLVYIYLACSSNTTSASTTTSTSTSTTFTTTSTTATEAPVTQAPVTNPLLTQAPVTQAPSSKLFNLEIFF